MQDRWGDSLDLLSRWAGWPISAAASATGPLSPTRTSLATGLRSWPAAARWWAWPGWRPGCSDPRRVGPPEGALATPSGTSTPRRALTVSSVHGDLCGWRAPGRAATSQGSSSWKYWTRRRTTSNWTGVSGHGQGPRALAGAGRGQPHNRRAAQRAAGVQPLADGRDRWWSSRSSIWQAPGRCAAGAGSCTGVRDVFRAPGALICLGRWPHRSPHDRGSTATFTHELEPGTAPPSTNPDHHGVPPGACRVHAHLPMTGPLSHRGNPCGGWFRPFCFPASDVGSTRTRHTQRTSSDQRFESAQPLGGCGYMTGSRGDDPHNPRLQGGRAVARDMQGPPRCRARVHMIMSIAAGSGCSSCRGRRASVVRMIVA